MPVLDLISSGNGCFPEVLTWLQVQNHVQSLAIVGHLFIQPCQVKLVLYVVFINLQKHNYLSQYMEINSIYYLLLQHTATAHIAATH